MKKVGLIFLLTILTINISAQSEERDRISFSISWTPVYGGPNDGEFKLDAILPLSLESIVNYRSTKRISISSGIGYERYDKTWSSWWFLSYRNLSKSQRFVDNKIRIPIQVNYHMIESLRKLDPYLKAEFISEFSFIKTVYYQFENIDHTESYKYYTPSIAFGIGTTFRTDKPIGILIEGSLGTYLIQDPLEVYLFRLKIGIVIN